MAIYCKTFSRQCVWYHLVIQEWNATIIYRKNEIRRGSTINKQVFQINRRNKQRYYNTCMIKNATTIQKIHVQISEIELDTPFRMPHPYLHPFTCDLPRILVTRWLSEYEINLAHTFEIYKLEFSITNSLLFYWDTWCYNCHTRQQLFGPKCKGLKYATYFTSIKKPILSICESKVFDSMTSPSTQLRTYLCL